MFAYVFMNCSFFQILEAESDLDIQNVFAMDEALSLLCDTGYRKAGSILTLNDRNDVIAALLDYHLMVKVNIHMLYYLCIMHLHDDNHPIINVGKGRDGSIQRGSPNTWVFKCFNIKPIIVGGIFYDFQCSTTNSR